MTDAAYENATALREHHRSSIALLQQQLDQHRRELVEVETFISSWERFAGVAPSPAVKDAGHEPKRSKPKNPSKEYVGEAVGEILRHAGAPLNRAELFDRLRARGVHLEGSEPQMILSTMLWRMQEKFVRVPRVGYWFTGEPIPDPTGANLFAEGDSGE